LFAGDKIFFHHLNQSFMKISKMRFSTALFCLAFLTSQTAIAQKKEDKLSISVALNHDAFFGFNPMLSASYPISKSADFTAYGIQWGAGTASAWGNWTEFGFGVNFKAGKFSINPQLGFTMGSLLSSGAANPGIIGDGIVPNLTVNYDDGKIVGQFYSGYYAALRNKTTTAGQATNNYMHYWINAGGKLTPWLAVGAHFENLYLAGGKRFGGGSLSRTEGYQWLGPFVQISKGAAGMRFSFGTDLAGEDAFSSNDFYKMSFFFNF
jgi:hypothetical protein